MGSALSVQPRFNGPRRFDATVFGYKESYYSSIFQFVCANLFKKTYYSVFDKIYNLSDDFEIKDELEKNQSNLPLGADLHLKRILEIGIKYYLIQQRALSGYDRDFIEGLAKDVVERIKPVFPSHYNISHKIINVDNIDLGNGAFVASDRHFDDLATVKRSLEYYYSNNPPSHILCNKTSPIISGVEAYSADINIPVCFTDGSFTDTAELGSILERYNVATSLVFFSKDYGELVSGFFSSCKIPYKIVKTGP